MKAQIKEIFESIQGEGPYVGEKQLFIRFCRCNLNCTYCDTDFLPSFDAKKYSARELFEYVNEFSAQTISLTGGEPLLESDFLSEFLPLVNKKIYLETNGTLYDNLKKIKSFCDVISMDIKLYSATGQKNNFDLNEEFLHVTKGIKTFIKIVYDENIADDELKIVADLAKKYERLLVLQPKMPVKDGFNPQEIFDKFYEKYQNIRLIPQTHKFLNIR